MEISNLSTVPVSKVNILYISYDGMTDHLGQSQVIPYLIGLSRQYSVTIISCEKIKNYSPRKDQIKMTLENENIEWYPINYTKQPPILSTLYDLYKIRRKAFALHSEKPFQIIHCRSYLSSLIGQEMKNKFNCKFIFDMRGFWADERVEGGLWKLSNPIFKIIYNYFKDKELQFLNEADYTISLTENAKQEILSWKALQKKVVPIKVIPCCVDLSHFSVAKSSALRVNELKYKLGLSEDNFILLYLGGIGTWYMLEEMLDFFKRLKLVRKEAKFLFVTAEDERFVRKVCDQKSIELSDVIVKSVERKDVPLYISLANYSIFFIRPTYSKKASSPTKQGELMAMGIPVICNTNVGDTDYVVNKFQSGHLIEKFIASEYDKAVGLLTDELTFNKAALRRGAEEYFSLEKGINLYNEVYSDVLKA